MSSPVLKLTVDEKGKVAAAYLQIREKDPSGKGLAAAHDVLGDGSVFCNVDLEGRLMGVECLSLQLLVVNGEEFHFAPKGGQETGILFHWAYCAHCDADTRHKCYYTGHERDMSGDWQECQVCRWTWTGMTGRYEPPTDG